MFRRIKTASLIALMALGVSTLAATPTSAALPDGVYESGNYQYVVSEGNAGIWAYVGSATSLTIPSEIDGYPVTYIRERAFYSKGLTSVTIPDTVERIGYDAFRNNQLTHITIPDSVTSLNTHVFADNRLTSITFGASNPYLGYGAFRNNRLTSVEIPDFVTEIAPYAFSNNLLTSVTIPDSVTHIHLYAFGFNQLSSITIPDSVTELGYGAFSDNRLTSVTIPSSVTVLGGSAFESNLLTSVDIPSSVTTLSSYVFSDNKFTSFTIPSWITTVDTGAFRTNLLTSVTIPSSVTTIGDNAFGINDLTSVSIPNSVTSIGNSAFSNNSLATLTIPSSVTSVGLGAFAYNQLTSVTIPSSLTEIAPVTFQNNLLTSVSVPSSVTSIGDSAFANNLLTTVSLPDSVTTIGPGAFATNDIASASLGNSVTVISDGAFADNLLSSIIIPDSTTTIGSYAFVANLLTSITIPASVRTLDSGAFAGNSLTSVAMGGHEPDTIGWAIFDGSDPLVTFPYYGYYTPGEPGYWNAGGTQYRVSGGSLPPGLGFGGEPVEDLPEWHDSWIPKGAPGPIAPWDDREYVALGDSFQSGEGTHSYYANTDIRGTNMCHRSAKAYPALLNQQDFFDGLDFEFWACSGARTDALLSKNTAPNGYGLAWNDPQLRNWSESTTSPTTQSALDRLTDDTAVVTIGIGGNDLGLTTALEECLLRGIVASDGFDPYDPDNPDLVWPITASCADELDGGLVNKMTDLIAKGTWTKLFEQIHDAAPNAQIYVLGYPRLFMEGGTFLYPCGTIRPSDQVWANEVIAFLNKIIEASVKATAKKSIRIQYIDTYEVGLNRELCSLAPEPLWFVNSIHVENRYAPLADLVESFHPNVYGHSVIANAFRTQAVSPVKGHIGSITEGETLSYSMDNFNTNSLSTSVVYRGSDIVTTLISPSGERFNRNSGQSNITSDNGHTWENLEITNPEPGEWTVELYGAEIDYGGEPFQFQWYAEPLPNVAPVASATVTQTGKTVTVNGASSHDPDGTIVETAFDFGDGTVKFGTTATHTYGDVESVQITMWVKDNLGAYDFDTVGTELVITPKETSSGGGGTSSGSGTGTSVEPSASPTPSVSPSPSPTPEPEATAPATPQPEPSETPTTPPGGDEEPSSFAWWILWSIVGSLAVLAAALWWMRSRP